MIHFYAYAIIPDKEQRESLLAKLRHHNIPFIEECNKVSVDANFLSYRSVEKLAEYFEETDYTERGLAFVESGEEVDYDSG